MWSLSLVAAASVISTLGGASAVEVAQGLGCVVGVTAVATLGGQVVSKRRGLVQGWLLVIFAFAWSAGLYAYHLIDRPGAGGSAGLAEAQRLIAIGESSYVLGAA